MKQFKTTLIDQLTDFWGVRNLEAAYLCGSGSESNTNTYLYINTPIQINILKIWILLEIAG